jgi:hypothetical protein
MTKIRGYAKVRNRIGTEIYTFNEEVKIEGLTWRASNNAQKGAEQPQFISPKDLVDNLFKSAPAFPGGTNLHLHLSKDSAHLLYGICN